MKKSTLAFLATGAFLYSCMALAADPAPVPDLTVVLVALWNAIQNHAGTSMILVPVFQLLRTHEVLGLLSKISGKYLQVVIAVTTTLGFVVDANIKGQSWGAAAITGFFVSGGAMLIFDSIRSINPPKPIA